MLKSYVFPCICSKIQPKQKPCGRGLKGERRSWATKHFTCQRAALLQRRDKTSLFIGRSLISEHWDCFRTNVSATLWIF